MNSIKAVARTMKRCGFQIPKPKGKSKAEEQEELHTLKDVLEAFEFGIMLKEFEKEYPFPFEHTSNPSKVETLIWWYFRGGKRYAELERAYYHGWKASVRFNLRVANYIQERNREQR